MSEPLTLTQYDLALRALAPSASGNGYNPGDGPETVRAIRWRCPAHGGSDALSLAQGDDGRALLTCFAGCEFAAIADALGLDHGAQPVTLDTLAAYLRLDREHLEDEGWQDDSYTTRDRQKIERVAMPYTNASTGDIVMRYRTSLGGTSKFRWQTRPSAHPKRDGLLYAFENLDAAKGQGIFLVEGESDVVALRHLANLLAVGLPGAGMWSEEPHAPLFANVAAIYVPLELDSGGSTLLDSLSHSAVRDKVWIVPLFGYADVRQLLTEHHNGHALLLDVLRQDGRLTSERIQTIDQFGDVQRAKQASTALAASGDIPATTERLERILDTIESNGLVGERGIAAAACLTFISSLGKKATASLIIKGNSSGGKSYTEEHVRKHFPASYFRLLSDASAKSLYYLPPGSLEHKVLVLAEATGLEAKDGGASGLAEVVRVLQSSGVLDYDTVVTHPGALPTTEHVHQDGPTALLVTTTATRLHPENETRCLSMEIDDSPAQTRRVIDMIGKQFAGKVRQTPTDQWHAFFEWLRLSYLDAEVLLPFAEAVSPFIAELAMRLRRDVSTLYRFVAAHALLHADLREVDADGCILATLDDYAAVVRYLGQSFTDNLDSAASEQDRETVHAVERVIERKGQSGSVSLAVNYVELADELGLDRSNAQRRAESALEGKWLDNIEKTPRRPAQIVIGVPLPDVEGDLLPTREQIEEVL